jgi:hypothetical protein
MKTTDHKIVKAQVILFTLLICFSSSAFSQNKLNPNPAPSLLLNKIKQYTKQNKFEGGHRTGSMYGTSSFAFYAFEPTSPIIYVNIRLEDENGRLYKTQESGILKKFRFTSHQPQAYGTKVFWADWGTDDNPNYGDFSAYLDGDIEKYLLNIAIAGKANWRHETQVELTEDQFQDLVNILTISGKPKNVRIERIAERAKKFEKDSIERAKKFEKDSIERTKQLEKDSIELIGLRKILTEETIDMGSFRMSKNNYPNRNLNWKDAKRECERLGFGWRLPTKSEMDSITKKYILQDVDWGYWNSTNGDDNISSKDKRNQFRPVRDLTPEEAKIFAEKNALAEALAKAKEAEETKAKELAAAIAKEKNKKLYEEYFSELIKKVNDNPIKIKNLLVSRISFNGMSWKEANLLCEAIGDGWRLANKKYKLELANITENWFRKLKWEIREVDLKVIPMDMSFTPRKENGGYDYLIYWAKDDDICMPSNFEKNILYRCNDESKNPRFKVILVKTKE